MFKRKKKIVIHGIGWLVGKILKFLPVEKWEIYNDVSFYWLAKDLSSLNVLKITSKIIRSRFVSHWLFIACPVSPLTTCDRSLTFPAHKSPRWHDDVRSVPDGGSCSLYCFSTRDNNETEWLVSSSVHTLRTAGVASIKFIMISFLGPIWPVETNSLDLVLLYFMHTRG